MALSLRLLKLDLSLKNLFLSLLILSCSSPKTKFSILEFSVGSLNQNFASLNSLLDVAYNVFLSDFDLVIIKNLNSQEELNLINNRVSFGSLRIHILLVKTRTIPLVFLLKNRLRLRF